MLSANRRLTCSKEEFKRGNTLFAHVRLLEYSSLYMPLKVVSTICPEVSILSDSFLRFSEFY